MTESNPFGEPAIFERRIEEIETALQGIAACATQCVCCEMHRKIAIKALGYDVEIVTDLT